MYLGSWKIDDLVSFAVNTHSATTGAEADADADPSYRVYEDETATPILTGTMAKLDDANTVGFYSEQITLSAANGFEKGKSYNIRCRAVVNSIAASVIHTLQIEAEVDANTVSPTVSANVVQISGDSGAADNAETAFDGGSYNVGGGGIVAASVAGNVGGNVNGNVVGSVASVTADVGITQGAADKVWLSAARTLTSFGTLVADIWAAATRTLTSFGTLTADAADKLLGRNLAGGSDGGRTVKDALRVLRNRRAIAAGTLTVYEEDDATPAWDASVATAASDPINSIDPA